MQATINFRHDFGKLDDLILVTPAEFAEVIAAPTVGSVYTQLQRGELPEPLIRKNRQIRWTVGQVRGHLRGLQDAFKLTQTARDETKGSKTPPLGRPRQDVGAA